jgi:hypothetical protein
MSENQRKMHEILTQKRLARQHIYDEYDAEELIEILDRDPAAVSALIEEFEKLPDDEFQKTFIADLILMRIPFLDAYTYMTQIRGRSPNWYEGTVGGKLLKEQGKIK